LEFYLVKSPLLSFVTITTKINQHYKNLMEIVNKSKRKVIIIKKKKFKKNPGQQICGLARVQRIFITRINSFTTNY